MGIAAVVNDEVISDFDVAQRIGLVAVSSGLDLRQAEVRRLRSQVIRSLIDETLKLQEAARFDVGVSDGEIAGAKQDIAQRNNTSVEEIEGLLRGAGIDLTTFNNQIRADIAWAKLVNGRYAPQAAVTQEQVEAALVEIEQNADQPQYLVSEIFLAINQPGEERAIQQAASSLISQLQSGVAFDALARQFSQSASAINGGDLGWVREGQLPPEIAQAIAPIPSGGVSQPIRGPGGLYIIGMRNKRSGSAQQGGTMINLGQVLYPLPATAPVEEAIEVANLLTGASEGTQGCEAMPQIASAVEGADFTSLSNVGMDQLPPEIRRVVAELPEGELSRPVRSNVGFHVLSVCKRETIRVDLPSRDDVENRLINREIDSLARRYLRDLRTDAVVEIR